MTKLELITRMLTDKGYSATIKAMPDLELNPGQQAGNRYWLFDASGMYSHGFGSKRNTSDMERVAVEIYRGYKNVMDVTVSK